MESTRWFCLVFLYSVFIELINGYNVNRNGYTNDIYDEFGYYDNEGFYGNSYLSKLWNTYNEYAVDNVNSDSDKDIYDAFTFWSAYNAAINYLNNLRNYEMIYYYMSGNDGINCEPEMKLPKVNAFIWIDTLEYLQKVLPCITYFDIHYEIKTFLENKVQIGLTGGEIAEYRKNSNYFNAKIQIKPCILFILGPSASGKTYAAKRLVYDATNGVIKGKNAVFVDGDILREASKATKYFIHKVSQLAQHGAAFLNLYNGYVKTWTSPLKKQFVKRLMKEKKNIIAPVTAVGISAMGITYFNGYTSTLKMAHKNGYTAYILVVYSTPALTQEKGIERGQTSGKAYSRKQYAQSLQNALYIIDSGDIPKKNIYLWHSMTIKVNLI
eukprot:366403_1